MTDTRPLLARIPRWVYIFLGSIILISLIILLLIQYRLEPYVAYKIRTAVNESSRGTYEADFTDIHISLLRKSISFDSLSLKPDPSVIESLREKKEAPKHIYQVDIKGVAFRNISFWDIYFHKKLDLESIIIQKPRITITYNDHQIKEESREQRTAYQQISKFLRSIHFNELILNEADFSYIDKSSSPAQTSRFKGLNVKVTEFRLDSASQHNTANLYYSQNIQLNLKNHKFTTKDGLYTIMIGDLSSSSAGKSLRLADFRVKPNYPEIEFSRKYKEQHDRYDLDFREIVLANIDIYQLNAERRLSASSLIINGADVSIFMNRSMPPVTFDKGRNYPHVVIRRLRLPTSIDSLLIKNTRISYSEFNPGSQKKGTVTFNRFNAVLKNVTNDSLRLKKNHWMRASVTAWLLNKGKMNVNINMHLTDPNAVFNFNGTMGSMDMRELNVLSRNMSLAEIESGTINKAIFNVTGNLRTTSGTLKLYYTNLKVNVLKNDEDSDTLKKRGLISTIANTLVIHNDNPGKNGELRVGNTVAERLDSGSFFNLMWKSIFSGLKESVGFTLGKPETQELTPLDKKGQRQLRREKRQKERQEKRAAKEKIEEAQKKRN